MSLLHIVLTSDKKLLSIGENFIFVNKKTIKEYNHNKNVVALVCSREVATIAQEFCFPGLRLVQLTSAGWDNVDLNHYRKNNVTVCNAADVYSVAMAEFVLYMMLQAAKRYNKNIKNKSIRLLRGYEYITELRGKTLGIMGVGSIGTEVAKRAEAFDMDVIGYANSTTQKKYFNKIYHKENIDEFVSGCDYLVVTLPHTIHTEELIDSSLLNKMKENVTIVNVGRKAVFNQKDFIAVLKKNRKMTAILDMFEFIPNLFTNPFRRMSNVVVTPGVTAISQEVNDKLQKLIEHNIWSLENNEAPKNILNP